MSNTSDSAPAGIPPRKWTESEVPMAISTLYSLWERGIGPLTVKVGGKRLIRETGAQYLARIAADQQKAA